jgi:hypothetical protein
MTDPEDAIRAMRRWARTEYRRQHEEQRRAADKAEGARRIDVTLRGKMLDDYATVRRYIEGLNRIMAERKIPFAEPFRLSDTEVIRMALSTAADHLREEDDKNRRSGLMTVLD